MQYLGVITTSQPGAGQHGLGMEISGMLFSAVIGHPTQIVTGPITSTHGGHSPALAKQVHRLFKPTDSVPL